MTLKINIKSSVNFHQTTNLLPYQPLPTYNLRILPSLVCGIIIQYQSHLQLLKSKKQILLQPIAFYPIPSNIIQQIVLSFYLLQSKTKKSKIKSEDILRLSKHCTSTVPSLPLHNRILIPSDRLGFKINDSYKINNKTKQFLQPASSLPIIKKQSTLHNKIIHTTIPSAVSSNTAHIPF